MTAALKLDMTIPLGTAGHVRLLIDIGDIRALDDSQRAFLADTCAEVCTLAGRVHGTTAAVPLSIELGDDEPAPAVIYDPNLDVLNGVTGTRRNTS